MKVLVITANIDKNNLGGAEHHVIEVSKRLAPKLEALIMPKIYLPQIGNLTWLFYFIFATPVMLYHALRSKPDLIWATLDFPQAQVGAIVKLCTGIPLYITSQNPLLGEQELVGFGGGVVKFFVAWAFGRADTVAAVSTFSANQATKLGAKHVVVIPNGV